MSRIRADRAARSIHIDQRGGAITDASGRIRERHGALHDAADADGAVSRDGHARGKPSSFRFDYSERKRGIDVVAKSILFDGKTLSTIDHRRKHFEQTAVAASAVTASIAFFAGPPPAQLAFDTSGRFGGKGDVVLELIPKTGPHLEWVVDPRDWHVRASIVVEANGDTTELELFSPDDQRVVRPGWFVLAPATLPGYSHP